MLVIAATFAIRSAMGQRCISWRITSSACGGLLLTLLIHAVRSSSLFTGAVTSAPSTLAVVFPPVITSQPTNLAVLQGSNASFAVQATGLAPLYFQWQFNGQAILPMEGVSLRPGFLGQPLARTAPIFFEHEGNAALRQGDWKLVRLGAKGPWELYNLNEDFSQYTDLASQYPEKVKDMKKLFMDEAKKYQVLPLDKTMTDRLLTPRPSLTAGRSIFTWTRPLTGTPNGDAPNLLNSSYTFKAEVEIPQGGAEGMLITQGGRFGGYGFYLLKGKPVWLWNLVDLERLKWEGAEALTPGRHTVEFDFKYDGLGPGTLAFNDFSGVGRPGRYSQIASVT